jgi:acetate kinase
LFSGQTEGAVDNDPLSALLASLSEQDLPAPEAIGHRIVHGGPNVRAHARIDAAMMEHLEQACAFAPLHVPPAVALVIGLLRPCTGTLCHWANSVT